MIASTALLATAFPNVGPTEVVSGGERRPKCD